MLKAKRITDTSAGTRTHRHPFWKSAPPVSEAETIKHKTYQTAKSVVPGPPRAQPVAVPGAPTTTTTYSRQNPVSNSFNVVRGNSAFQDPRNAVSTTAISGNTTAPAPIPRVQAPVPVPRQHQQQQQQQQAIFAKNNNISSSKPDTSVHRVSVQSLNSVNTASTSPSSFERISTEDLKHSWTSTAPSSTIPHSTDSLVCIPAASETRDTSSAARRFPLVESDVQRKHEETHGDTHDEQASNALPLPNSEYESPARMRSLRRSKPNINVSTTSVRVATSTTGRQSPAPEQAPVRPPSPSKPQGQHHHQRSKSDMLAGTELAYVRPHRMEENARLGDNGRATLLARVMATSSSRHTHSPSTASSRTMPGQPMPQPRVSGTSQQANPNMTKLKQTSIPRISTNGIVTGSPMIEQTRQLDSLQSPLKASADHTLSAWTSAKSPTMTSAAAYSSLTSAVMSPNLSSVTSPRTLVSGSHHHSEVAAITPSQHYSLSASSSTGSTVGITAKPYVEPDYDSGASTVTPGTPSHTVRALFSSFTSRSHRNSTPHPLRASSVANPPIVSQEVDSPRIAPAHVLTPPPLPPQSTRPDAAQQSFTHTQIHAQEQHFNVASPRHHTTADLRASVNSRATVESRRDSVAGIRSPSPNSVLRSYGLASSNAGDQSPSVNAHRLMGTPFHSPRTLMSDSEVTTVTTVVTRSTVLMPAGQAVPYSHPIERRSSNSSARRESSVVGSNNRVGGSQQQQYTPSLPTQTPQSPLSHSQPVPGGFFGMFRPKSPRHPFPRAESPAVPPPPVPSKTPPPRSATASPSRRFAFSLPINLRHKPKKSISGASVEAVIGGERVGTPADGAMSSQASLLPTRMPDLHISEFPGGNGQAENGRRLTSAMGSQRRDTFETDTEFDGDDDNDEPPIEVKMMAVEQWSRRTEANFATSGKRRSRPGVSFELPPSESERDDTGMTAVSVAPGGGRILRYGRSHSRPHHHQFSDNESVVY